MERYLVFLSNFDIYFILANYFHSIGPLGRFSHRVAKSVCLSERCLWQVKTTTSRCPGDFWLKGILLILAWNDTIFSLFFSALIFFWGDFGASLQWVNLLWIIGEFAGWGSVAVAVAVNDRWHMTYDNPPRPSPPTTPKKTSMQIQRVTCQLL